MIRLTTIIVTTPTIRVSEIAFLIMKEYEIIANEMNLKKYITRQ